MKKTLAKIIEILMIVLMWLFPVRPIGKKHETKIREKATEDWKKFAPTFRTNPYFMSGYIAGYERALAELSSVPQANELLPHVSGSICNCEIPDIQLSDSSEYYCRKCGKYYR